MSVFLGEFPINTMEYGKFSMKFESFRSPKANTDLHNYYFNIYFPFLIFQFIFFKFLWPEICALFTSEVAAQ